MNSPALHLPPEHLSIPAPGWSAPVQTDLFGQSLLDSLDLTGRYYRENWNPSAPNSSGFFLEGLHPVRIQPLPQPAWCTVFLCYRDPNPEDVKAAQAEWFSGVAGGLAFGPRADDRLFYFHGTPHQDAPSASLDAAVRHALDEARGMFAHYHGAGDGATAMAAQALAELLRRA